MIKVNNIDIHQIDSRQAYSWLAKNKHNSVAVVYSNAIALDYNQQSKSQIIFSSYHSWLSRTKQSNSS